MVVFDDFGGTEYPLLSLLNQVHPGEVYKKIEILPVSVWNNASKLNYCCYIIVSIPQSA